MPGPGEALSSVTDALKTSPLVLALVLLQAVTLGFVYYAGIERQSATSAQFERVYSLLDKCLAKGNAQ